MNKIIVVTLSDSDDTGLIRERLVFDATDSSECFDFIKKYTGEYVINIGRYTLDK